MAKSTIDAGKLTITCPNCAKQIEEPIGRLKRNPKLTCPRCKRTIDVEGIARIEQADHAVEEGIADFRKTIRKFNKRFG